MDAPQDGHWVEDALLPELPTAPPADIIATDGAQLIHVINVDAHRRPSRGGHTEAVILASAPLADGGTGVLIAWLSAWQEKARTTGKGRYAWCRMPDDERVVFVKPPPHRPETAWYGWGQPNELDAAIEQAAATLPEHLRETAVTPKPPGQ